MRHWTKSLIVGAATGLMGALLGLTPLGVDLETSVGLNWLFKVRGPIDSPADVVVVAINEHAAEELGLPPLPRDWQRSIHARLIENLVKRGASTIVFDMDFHKPKSSKHDLEFAKAVAQSARVVLVERLNGKRQPVFDVNGRQTGSVWTEELILPIPELVESARGLAPFPVPKVQERVYQFWAFKPSLDGAATLPGVALQIHALDSYAHWLRILEQVDPASIKDLPRHSTDLVHASDLHKMMHALRRAFKNDPGLGEKVEIALSTEDGQGMSSTERRLIRALARFYAGDDNPYLNFYGPPGTITTIPYNAVITGNDPRTDQTLLDFTDKIVFVGHSDLYDPGQQDRFYTVFTRDDGVDLSGVEIAATALGNLLTDRTLKPSDGPTTATILLLFGVILGAGVYLLSAMLSVPLALILTSLYIVGVQFAFNSADVWLPLATPVFVQLPMALFIGLLGQYLLERHHKERISKASERMKGENLVLRHLTNRLKKLNEQKNKFLGMAAHDLRNPIGAILGYSEMLLEEDLREDDRKLVEQIESSSKFMLHLLNDLLDISQIESGKLELHREKTNLVSLVSQNIELNRIIAEKKHIEIRFVCHEDIPKLEVDSSKLMQVLNNLISNAIKFSHPNTTITVTLSQQEDQVCFSVKDQGQGIPAEEVQKVFQEFQITSVKSTAGEKSTGLGLAIVKKIIEGHGGTIGVESQVEQGSTFHFALPIEQKPIQGHARKEKRLVTYLPVQFSVARTANEGIQEEVGTSLDLTTSGMLIDSAVPLQIDEEICFSLQLPDTLVIGTGRVARQTMAFRYGVQFLSLQDDSEQQIQKFLLSISASVLPENS